MTLRDHEYALVRTRAHAPTTDQSQLARVLQPFWNAALRVVPDDTAPNTLTVLGSAVVVIPTVLALWTSPDLTVPLPAWLIVLQILGIFVFQTLDALDGKQARRTGTSSPLGSWLDHALDVITMQFVLIGVCASVQSGLGVAMWTMMAGTIVNNYLLHWESSHTRALILGNGTSITEAQVMAMVVHLVAMVGPTIFPTAVATHVPALARLPFSDAALGNWVLVLSVVVVGGAGALASVRRALATDVARGESLRRLVCIVCLMAPASLAWFSITDATARLLFGCAVLLVASQAVGRMVLENLVQRAPATIDGPTAALVVASAVLLAMPSQAGVVAIVAIVAIVAAVTSVLVFFVQTTRELAAALGVRIFSLQPVASDG